MLPTSLTAGASAMSLAHVVVGEGEVRDASLQEGGAARRDQPVVWDCDPQEKHSESLAEQELASGVSSFQTCFRRRSTKPSEAQGILRPGWEVSRLTHFILHMKHSR